MKFLDFFKDRISYAIVYFISISISILIMYLTMFIKSISFPATNVLYAYLISIVLFIVFLLYEYLKVRNFYNRLYEVLISENVIEDIINLGTTNTMEEKLFKKILYKLHKSYENKSFKYEEMKKHYSYFINQWVHQMKTPISVIKLILQEENRIEFKEIFDSIGEEVDKISQGLNIMLYNARLNEFNHDFNVEDVDILLILRKAINDNKKLLIKNKIFPKITGESTIVHTDKKWIYFAINQIIINAIKYTIISEKDKKIIDLQIKNDPSKIIVSIKDNGIGIPREDLGRIFNAFFTGKNGRKASESTGMGLYLVKRICNNLGNELYVESKQREGSTFYIVFYKTKNIFKL